MKEILAQNLQSLFNNTYLHGECTYKGNKYEVWEVSDEDFETICNMPDDDFMKICPGGLRRSSEGSNMSVPFLDININHKKILAWPKLGEYGRYSKYSWDSLLEYFCEAIGASSPQNVCALAVDLAIYNDMKMSELFKIYEG